jgi:uncharacterized protein
MSSLSYQAPGVYVEEVPSAQQPIAGVGTSTAGFIGIVPDVVYLPVPNPDYDPVLARAMRQLEALQARRKELEKAGTLAANQAALDNQQAALQTAAQRALDAAQQMWDQEEQKRKAAEAREKTASEALATAGTAVKDAQTALKGAADEGKQRAQSDLDAATSKEAASDRAHREALDELNVLTQSVADKKTALDNAKTALEQAAQPSPAADTASTATSTATATTTTTTTTTTTAEGGASGSASQASVVETEPDTFTRDDLSAELRAPSLVRPYFLKPFPVKVDPLDTKFCTNFTEYADRFGSFSAYQETPDQPYPNSDKWIYSAYFPGHHALTHAVNGFFRNGGTRVYVARIRDESELEAALERFKSIDDLSIIAAPGLPRNADTWESLMSHAENRENCFAILDAPGVVNDGKSDDLDIGKLSYSNPGSVLPRASKNAAVYFPHIEVVDPAKQLQDADPRRLVGAKYRGRTYVAPSGHIAGIYSRTDAERGVHKAPANCVVRGALEVKYYISKPVQMELNPQGVNAIRIMNNAVTVWGARTVSGDANGEWKYISVRRLFLFLQKSIELGTQWIVFEPNDPALWAKIRLNITAFLTNVWRSGALFGVKPEEAFYVKCDAELNPPEVRDAGQVVTEIGVAIVRPAEFVIFRITQATGIGQS